MMLLTLEVMLALVCTAGAAFVAGVAYVGCHSSVSSQRRVAIVIGQAQAQPPKEISMPDVTMLDSEQVPVPSTEADAAGFSVGGSVRPNWTIDDVSIATMGVALDGSTPAIVAVKPGTTTAHASLDLGAGAKTIDVGVTVNAGPAVSFSVDPGAPEVKPGF